MIEAVVDGLLHANLALGAAVLAVAGLRKPVRRWFGARAAYGLWLAVPLAAAAVLAPRPQAPTVLSPVAVSVSEVFEAAPVAASGGLDAPAVLFGLWVAGALAAAGLLVVRQARFMGEVRAGRAGPAVVGALRPRIVTPADFEARFAADERAVILSHEAVHLESGDARVNAVAAGLSCLCWFNPLVHVGAHLMRIDQELACDAAVLGRHPQARRLYAEALLKTQLTTQPLPLGCHWPSAAEHPLKERIVMLKSPLPRRARRLAGLAVVALLGAGGAAAAWAAQPVAVARSAPAPTIAQPVWLEKPTGEDIARLYPADARRLATDMRIDGSVTCKVAEDGRLRDCISGPTNLVTYGSLTVPKGGTDYGIPAAMLQLAKHFRMAPVSRDGVKTAGGWVKIPVIWNNGPPHRDAKGDIRADAVPTIDKPQWLERPTGADIARLYPTAAARIGAQGQVVITCEVGRDGRLSLCAVASSQVEGVSPSRELEMDFGTATLALAKSFRAAPSQAGGVVRIPVRWVTPET